MTQEIVLDFIEGVDIENTQPTNSNRKVATMNQNREVHILDSSRGIVNASIQKSLIASQASAQVRAIVSATTRVRHHFQRPTEKLFIEDVWLLR